MTRPSRRPRQWRVYEQHVRISDGRVVYAREVATTHYLAARGYQDAMNALERTLRRFRDTRTQRIEYRIERVPCDAALAAVEEGR